MIIYTDILVPRGFDAITIWPFIFIRPSVKNDTGLLGHEMIHYVEQAWITPFWLLFYLISSSFRVEAEVRAYQTQVDCGELTVDQAATWLLKYDSALTLEVAKAFFKEKSLNI
jgi:hypothetical protein